MGSIMPGIGTALGAAIGAAVGGLSGGLQIYEKKDDAFKSYVEDAYETVTGEQSSSLTSGSSIAGSREQTQHGFCPADGRGRGRRLSGACQDHGHQHQLQL